MGYEYAAFLIITTLPLLIFAIFHNFSKSKRTKFPIFEKFLLGQAVAFIALDSFAISRGWWSLNPEYISGIKIGNVPVEEALFFLAIPWLCLFVWVIIKNKYSGENSPETAGHSGMDNS